MDALSKNTLAKLAFFQLLIAVLLFLPAWTLHFWQAWLFWMLFTAAQLTSTVYFLRTDPHLIENRLKAGPRAESRPAQKLILFFAVILSRALVILPGLDHRLGWSVVPVPWVLLGACPGLPRMASDTDIENKLSQHVQEASGFTSAARAILYRKSL
jgi:hypothetical protein